MGKKREKVNNLGKKIYFVTYAKPRYKLEISKMIYGYESKAIYPEIKKLERLKWIKQKKPNDLDIGDKRAYKRQYYIAETKPLMDYVIERLKKNNINFTKEELKELELVLYVDYTAELIDSVVDLYGLDGNIDLFPIVIENLNFYFVLLSSWVENHEKYMNLDLDKLRYIRIHRKLANLNPNQSKIMKPLLGFMLSMGKLKGQEIALKEYGIEVPKTVFSEEK